MTRQAAVRNCLAAAFLILGLVGMHHLVVTACHHSGTTHAPALAPTVVGSPTIAPDGDPAPGAVGALCLAVFLGLAGAVVGSVARAPRGSRPVRSVNTGRVPDPPDLNKLAVSRT